jgi:thymidylate kinase
VIELVGVAGAGKTTLLHRLAVRDRGLLCRHGVWRLPRPRLLTSAVRMLPVCAALWRRAGSLAWDETKHIVRLDAIFRFLGSRRVRDHRAVLLDEGPVFVLAWLRTIGRDAAGPSANPRWWRRTLARWGAALDVIVVLDAPNDALIARIKSRAKEHQIKEEPEQNIAQFLDAYRASFAETIDELTRGSRGPEIVRVRSDVAPPDVLADDLLGRLNGRARAG